MAYGGKSAVAPRKDGRAAIIMSSSPKLTAPSEARSTRSTKRNGSPPKRETTMNGNKIHDSNGTHPNGSSNKLQASCDSKLGIFLLFLRTLVLDMPLVLLLSVYISVLLLHHVYDEYLVPQAELMRWTEERKTNEMTYYDRSCTVKDMSTNSTDDLLISSHTTPTQCMHHMAKHGVSLYPNILQEETADELREWIVQHNKMEEGFYVISGKHRFTFGIGVNQAPIVTQALKEIAEHPVFRPAIEEICGANPAVIEFTAITSEFGAEDQFWHQDTLPQGSSFKHARTFVPSYSLFVPLQDTTPEIGATEICPGSHVCNGRERFCVEHGFPASGKDGVWPKSTGALVNQHLYHRGMAHTDPNGLDRVLFILTFSPRPRMNPGEVETRLISMGGSYSLNWRQWGHTLNDFGNAATAMTEPWKTLKSLGLHKSKDSDWGWDMPAVASMRIINDDNGYHVGDLEDWLETKGGFSFLPAELQAEFDEETGWPGFLETTLKNCERAAERIYCFASGIYLILFMTLSRYRKLCGTKTSGAPFVRAVIRIVVSHAAVIALACYAAHSIGKTPWAQNIRHGRAHTLPMKETFPVDMLPGTLPNKRDVLAETKYESKYLAGTNYIIENAQPGNVNFNEIVAANSVGYEGLSLALKLQLTLDIIDWVGQDMGRFLTQNEEGNWAKMSTQNAQKFVHKSIVKTTNPVVANVLTELAYLVSETKFGVLRDTAMHRLHIPDMLNTLQDLILDPPTFVWKNDTDVTTAPSSNSESSFLILPHSFLPEIPTLGENVAPVVRRPSLPPIYEISEPYPGAWLEEGDIVEAKYNGIYNEWYRATIVDINVDASTYDVKYDDGEADDNLCRVCVRPYEPLQLGEEVEVHEEEADTFYKGVVVAVHNDDTVDIDTGENGFFESVVPGYTRRTDPEPEIKVGSRVEALYQRGKVWYDAVVTKLRSDGTFDVLYDDGDTELRVKRKNIRVLP